MAGTPDIDPSFDRYARMVRRALDVPVALVSFVERTRRVFPGAGGVAPFETDHESALTLALGRQVVDDAAPLVLGDVRAGERFAEDLLVDETGVVGYAGWPITDDAGTVIGSLCAIHHDPHAWTDAELEALADLAAACSAEVAQRELHRGGLERERRAERATGHAQLLLALSEALADTRTVADVAVALQHVAREQLDCSQAGVWLRAVSDPAGIGRPDLTRPGPPETLTYVAHPETDWPRAVRLAQVPLDGSNPLGDALISGEPIFYSEEAQQDVRYPRIAGPDRSGQARAIWPLSMAGNDYGALALVWPGQRRFTTVDRVTVAVLASYTTQAVQRALLLQERVDVSLTLQTAMLTRLPQPEGLQLAARYRPAGARDQVGGDWYDAVVVPDGSTHLVIGDVVGHDIAAATMMGQLRNMMRAFAWVEDGPPSYHVQQLDTAIRDFGMDTFATLLHARIEAHGDGTDHTLSWSSAGHLSPLLFDGDDEALYLEDGGQPDLLLGVDPDRRRRDQTRTIRAGSTLLLFTDGLVENRHEALLDGIARARAALTRHHRLPLDELLDAVIDELVDDHPEDDVAVLAARFAPAPA